MNIKKRFMQFVKVNPKTGCWEWQGAIFGSGNGYGAFKVKDFMWRAHRFSYKFFVGEIPKNKLVCHTCDNTKCVNPEHLFLGTNQDNMDDMKRKGREYHPTEKHKEILRKIMTGKKRIFSKEHRIKIGLAHKGMKHTEESKKKMSDSLKGKMVGSKNPMYGNGIKVSGEKSGKTGLTSELVLEIRKFYDRHYQKIKISDMFVLLNNRYGRLPLEYFGFYQIVKRLRWRHI